MNGKRLKIYDAGELIYEPTECIIPFEKGWTEFDPVIKEANTEPIDIKQFQYIQVSLNDETIGTINYSHWSEDDWNILVNLIRKYNG